MRKRYNFDRDGYAQGLSVHADNMEKAIQKARELNMKPEYFGERIERSREKEKIIFRDNKPCLPVNKCEYCNFLR